MDIHLNTDLSQICQSMAAVSMTPRLLRVNKVGVPPSKDPSKLMALRHRNVLGSCNAAFGIVGIDRKILLTTQDIAKFNISPEQYRTAVRRSPRLTIGHGKMHQSVAESAMDGDKGYESTYNFDSPLRNRRNLKESQICLRSGFGGRRRGLTRAGRMTTLRKCADGRLTTVVGFGVVLKGCSVCSAEDVVKCSCVGEKKNGADPAEAGGDWERQRA